ncbi:hypothetical protein [Burkholderia pseudomallei]|uniref:hypothetical protein n=1 Tax=Burkholderia pseudomallei TaxID=28450 RepID=UPI0018A1E650|nr:hypothetical protein [Burkholderia pseudomallei]
MSRFISRMPRDIDIGASGIPYSASGLWHPASIHRASRPHGLFHNFCWQACGHPEHPPSNTLIRRHFPETVRNAASRLKSVRRASRAPSAAESAGSDPAATILHNAFSTRQFSTVFVRKLVDISRRRAPSD